MSDYTAPIEDIKFTLRQVAGLESVTSLPGFEEVTDDIVDAVLVRSWMRATWFSMSSVAFA